MLKEISKSVVLWVKLIFIFPSTLPPSLFHSHDLKGDPSLSVYQEITNYFMFLVCEKKSAKGWLLTNWKSFRSYASYNDLTSCWSSFDGVRNHFENRASFSCFAQQAVNAQAIEEQGDKVTETFTCLWIAVSVIRATGQWTVRLQQFTPTWCLLNLHHIFNNLVTTVLYGRIYLMWQLVQ